MTDSYIHSLGTHLSYQLINWGLSLYLKKKSLSFIMTILRIWLQTLAALHSNSQCVIAYSRLLLKEVFHEKQTKMYFPQDHFSVYDFMCVDYFFLLNGSVHNGGSCVKCFVGVWFRNQSLWSTVCAETFVTQLWLGIFCFKFIKEPWNGLGLKKTFKIISFQPLAMDKNTLH